MGKKLLVFLGICGCLAVSPVHADTVTAVDPFNSGPVPASPFTLVDLGSSATPENQLVSTATIGPIGGETISFTGGASQAGSQYVSGIYVGSVGGVATSPTFDSTTDYLAAQPSGSSSTGINIAFTSPQTSFDLLWGTIDVDQGDNLNYLTFYNGSTVVATVTGSDIAAVLTGDSSFIAGTTNAYVEISDLPSFTSVVASDPGTNSAFEFIPGVDAPAAPEPGLTSLLAVGLAALAALLLLGESRRRAAADC